MHEQIPIGSIVKRSIKKWWASNPASLGAALSYYTLFSLVPLVVIIILGLGMLLRPDIVEQKVISGISNLINEQSGSFVQSIIKTITSTEHTLLASIIGLITLVIGSIGMFGQLQFSLDQMWHVPEPRVKGVWIFIKRKLLAFAMVIAIGFLLVVSVVATTLTSLFETALNEYIPNLDTIITLSNYVLSFGLACIMFMLMYKYLPNERISTRAATAGAIITSTLFIIGKFIISLYLSWSTIATSYAGAAAVIVLLIWVYYASQIFFLGAAFTYTIDEHLKI